MVKKKNKKTLEPIIIPQSDDFIYGTHPRTKLGLVGHHKVAESLSLAFLKGNIPQAILLTGPKGIGKATFTYHVIRALERCHAKPTIEDIYDTQQDDIHRRLSSGAMGNLKILRRNYNEKTKKFYQNIRMEDLREIKSFFTLASHSDGYRYCVIDCVDDMVHGAGSVPNALLKTLEEPPSKTIFFLIAHREGNIMPTIKSRCQHFRMLPPENASLKTLLDALPQFKNLSEDQQKKVLKDSGGSIRQAIFLSDIVWQKLFTGIKHSLLKNLPPHQAIPVSMIKDKFLQKDQDVNFLSIIHWIFLSAIHSFILYVIKNNPQSPYIFHQSELYEKINHLFFEAEAYNFTLYDSFDAALQILQHYFYQIQKSQIPA